MNHIKRGFKHVFMIWVVIYGLNPALVCLHEVFADFHGGSTCSGKKRQILDACWLSAARKEHYFTLT